LSPSGVTICQTNGTDGAYSPLVPTTTLVTRHISRTNRLGVAGGRPVVRGLGVGRDNSPGARQGQGTLEFALVSLMLMTLFMGVLDLGRGVFQRQDLANAAREGARFAMIAATSRAKTVDNFAADVAAVANQRSASLGLTAANFGASGGGSLTCETWASAAAPRQLPAWASALGLLPRGGLLGFGAGLIAKQPTPTPVPGGGGSGGGSWTTLACASAQPGDRLTVCVGYTFRPVASLLLKLGALAMSDCAAVTIQ
jgi:hypothetical protein